MKVEFEKYERILLMDQILAWSENSLERPKSESMPGRAVYLARRVSDYLDRPVMWAR